MTGHEDHEVGTQKTDGEALLGHTGLIEPEPSANAKRWGLLGIARSITRRKSLQTCGLYSHSEGRVAVSVEGGKSSVTGLMMCGSKLCPVCFSRKSAEQISLLERAATRFMGKGGRSALFLTLTLPHEQGDDLKEQLDALQKAWHASFSARGRPSRRTA